MNNEFEDSNEFTKALYNKLYGVFRDHVPTYKIHKRSYSVWYISQIIRNKKAKAKLFKKSKARNFHTYLEKYKYLRSLIKSQISDAYNEYFNNIQPMIHNDSKHQIFQEICYLTILIIQILKKLWLLLVHSLKILFQIFVSVVSANIVSKSMIKLNHSWTDDIPSYLVKDCVGLLAFPLSKIFNLGLKSEKIPPV